MADDNTSANATDAEANAVPTPGRAPRTIALTGTVAGGRDGIPQPQDSTFPQGQLLPRNIDSDMPHGVTHHPICCAGYLSGRRNAHRPLIHSPVSSDGPR